ncbi:choloylglycine hydrolase family protein [Martelella lutilitoris]|uniref:Choloylglycine hydrolase family protein n=1 Tax=Martelella lutilitoris TaxID=2583532 RepID=A0A7T7KMS8_9HYPH|nr:choloylglycine hydrolase family protein [Martelella lutilitoris]QQM31818.1 choloylglycine hydrolase family protein [Martelella lutilitoris]
MKIFSSKGRTFMAAALASVMFSASVAEACTGITLTAEDGDVVRARTMEFNVDLDASVILVPRGTQRTGETPDGKTGLGWDAKYASIGANPMGLPYLVDGVNEKGLSMGLFYFAQAAEYQPYKPEEAGKTMASWQLGSYILDNFATVDEVKAALSDIVVAPVIFKQFNMVLPVHFVVTDASGETIVIEYVGGTLQVSDNPLGTFTNNPPFDWHMTNLQNYVNLGVDNVPPQKLGDVTIEGLGQGTGLLGMPGDFTSPSRFVRAAIYSHGVEASASGNDAIFQAFHILNNFDIPRGVAREEEKDEHGNTVSDYTQWTSAVDTANKRFFFRTYENSDIRFVDLMKQDLDASGIKTWTMDGYETAHELGAPE